MGKLVAMVSAPWMRISTPAASGGDGGAHGDAVVAVALHLGAVQRASAVDDHAVLALLDLGAHVAQEAADGGDAVGFLHAQLARRRR